MAQYVYVYINHSHLQNWYVSSCYLTTAALNDCYSEVKFYLAVVLSASNNLYLKIQN